MKKYLEILLGLVLIVGVVYSNVRWDILWHATKTVLIGGVVLMAVMVGLLFLLLGLSELKGE